MCQLLVLKETSAVKVYDSGVCFFPPLRFLCFIGEFTLQLLYGFTMNLQKAFRLQTSRRSEQPLSQFVTFDKSKTDKQTKKCKKFGFPPHLDRTKPRPAPSTPPSLPASSSTPPCPHPSPSSLSIITLWYKCWTPTIGRRGWLRRLSICPGSGGGRS